MTSHPQGLKPGRGPFVSRDDELRRLNSALTLAAEGRGGIIFITGQPGIGKTRLVQEAIARAKARGFAVLEGRAYPLETGLTYAPFLDVLGPVLRSLDPAHRQNLISDLPSLGYLFESLHLPPPEPLNDPALEKTRLFETVLRLLERLAQQRPLVLFIDDVQWADHASLELLHYVARGLANRRALVLATFSSDALATSHRLRALVAPLQRARLSTEIFIPRLEPQAVEDLAKSILDGEPPRDLLSLLDSHACGIPLFIEAVISALVDSGGLVYVDNGWKLSDGRVIALPPSIRLLILERLDRLAPVERRVLDQIAVMGDATSYPILRSASDLEGKTLLEALRKLRAAGLVVEGMNRSDVAYSLALPLVQEVARSELPEEERCLIHKAAIEAIESFSEGQSYDLSRLAYHYQGAGSEADRSRALTVLLKAGERALAIYASEEAARHYSAALAIVRETLREGEEVASGKKNARSLTLDFRELLPWLLEQLGEALERTKERKAAISAWSEALVEREKAGPSQGRTTAAARLRCRLALAECDRGCLDVASAHISSGLVALADHEPCEELADLYYARYNILNRLGDKAGAAETAEQLLDLARQLASPRSEAEANLAAAISCLWQADVTNARERVLHALAVADQAGELAICCRAHTVLASTGMRLGDHHFMRHHAERGLGVAQRLGAPTIEVFLRLRLALANFLSGDWDESLSSALETIAIARRIGYPRDLARSLAGRGLILALRGDLSEAETCISEARTAFGSGLPIDRQVFGLVDMAETQLAIERGQAERALSIARGFISTSEEEGSSSWISTGLMPMGLVLLAEAEIMVGDPVSALEIATEILTLGPPDTPYLTALASRSEGVARLALGQRQAAAACLARAHDIFIRLEMPFEAARSFLKQAEAIAAEQPELAARATLESITTFERLGARRYLNRARRFLRTVNVCPPVAYTPHLRRVSLSPREVEIARLVAEGLTTAEIAKRLTISPRTVTTHLERIYARLQIGSRAALTRCVSEAGLL